MERFALPQRMKAVQTPIIPVVAQLIREHPGTISLGQGVVGYPPPPQALSKLADFFKAAESHKYQPVQGIPELIAALQRKLKTENQIAASEQRIFVTAGGNMAFLNAILAITNPGDEVILQSPYYFNHEMAITMFSCKPVLARTTSDFQLDLEQIERAITSRTRAIVTISPNNPTGAVYSRADLEAVNELCRTRGLYHIHDEAYEYFTWDEAEHFSPGSRPASEDYTISLFSLSKAYGFASWRIGYMVVPSHLIDAIRKIQDTNVICPPVISQYAALGALEAGRDYCRAQQFPILQNRILLRQELGSLGEMVEIPKAAGAFYYLLGLKQQMDPFEAASFLIHEHQVAVIPGTAFGLKDGCFLRVAYGALTPELVTEACVRLKAGLQALCS